AAVPPYGFHHCDRVAAFNAKIPTAIARLAAARPAAALTAARPFPALARKSRQNRYARAGTMRKPMDLADTARPASRPKARDRAHDGGPDGRSRAQKAAARRKKDCNGSIPM